MFSFSVKYSLFYLISTFYSDYLIICCQKVASGFFLKYLHSLGHFNIRLSGLQQNLYVNFTSKLLYCLILFLPAILLCPPLPNSLPNAIIIWFSIEDIPLSYKYRRYMPIIQIEIFVLVFDIIAPLSAFTNIFFSIYVIQFLILHIIIRMQVLNIFMRIISIRVRLYHGNRYVRTMIRYSLVIV